MPPQGATVTKSDHRLRVTAFDGQPKRPET
jgi:hypothetical protein